MNARTDTTLIWNARSSGADRHRRRSDRRGSREALQSCSAGASGSSAEPTRWNRTLHGIVTGRVWRLVACRPLPYFWTYQCDAAARTAGRTADGNRSAILRTDDTSLVVILGRGGSIRVAICVNSPRVLVSCRQMITEKLP